MIYTYLLIYYNKILKVNATAVKPIYILFIGVLVCLNVNFAYAQTMQQTTQKKYGDEIYNISYDESHIDITNTRDTLDSEKLLQLKQWCYCDSRYTDGLSILPKVMKSVFSQEKRKALADSVNRKRITFFICFDAVTGQIADVKFWLYGVSFSEQEESFTSITIKEIYQLETRLKAQQLKVTDCNCTGVNTKFKYSCCTYLMPINRMDEWND